MNQQEKQFVHNPSTGKMMEAQTYTGKELLWRDAGEGMIQDAEEEHHRYETGELAQGAGDIFSEAREKREMHKGEVSPDCQPTGDESYWIRGT